MKAPVDFNGEVGVVVDSPSKVEQRCRKSTPPRCTQNIVTVCTFVYLTDCLNADMAAASDIILVRKLMI